MLRAGEELRNRLRAGNIALFGINALAGGVWLFYWPLLGWGTCFGQENRSLLGTVVARSGGVLIAAALVILVVGLIRSG